MKMEPYIWLSSKSIRKLKEMDEEEIINSLSYGLQPIGSRSAWWKVKQKNLNKIVRKLKKLNIPYIIAWIPTSQPFITTNKYSIRNKL